MHEAISLSLSIKNVWNICSGSGFWKLVWFIFLNKQPICAWYTLLCHRVMNKHIVTEVNDMGSGILCPADKCGVISVEISSLQLT